MANKEFQVRHGLIVNNTVLVANTITNNVGIGTATPGYALDVVGTVNASAVLVNGSQISANLTPAFDQANNANITAIGAFNKANDAYSTAQSAFSTANSIGNVNTFISLTDTPSSYVNSAGYFVVVDPSATGLAFTSEIQIDELVHTATIAPANVSNDSVSVYVTASGTTPNREVAYKIKNELGEEVIISSILV